MKRVDKLVRPQIEVPMSRKQVAAMFRFWRTGTGSGAIMAQPRFNDKIWRCALFDYDEFMAINNLMAKLNKARKGKS